MTVRLDSQMDRHTAITRALHDLPADAEAWIDPLGGFWLKLAHVQEIHQFLSNSEVAWLADRLQLCLIHNEDTDDRPYAAKLEVTPKPLGTPPVVRIVKPRPRPGRVATRC